MTDFLNAKAFTFGNHISFGTNEFVPQTRSGQSLIAHDLAHVVQNHSGNPSARSIEPNSSRAEIEAYRQVTWLELGFLQGR